MLACFCNELQVVIAQERSKGGYDEVTTAIRILREMPLKNIVVTGDAMFADKHFCETVIQQGGNYVLTVKGNHPALKQAIEESIEAKKLLPNLPRRKIRTWSQRHKENRGFTGRKCPLVRYQTMGNHHQPQNDTENWRGNNRKSLFYHQFGFIPSQPCRTAQI